MKVKTDMISYYVALSPMYSYQQTLVHLICSTVVYSGLYILGTLEIFYHCR